MSLSDIPFPYGPFVPHHVPKQYIENYFAQHGIDQYLQLGTTVEDVSRSPQGKDRWVLTLRKYDAVEHVDRWWKEAFDAVVFGNGHYSVPYVCSLYRAKTFANDCQGRRRRGRKAQLIYE